METENSKRFSLDKVGLAKIGKGALIAITGALLTYVTEQIPHIDLGQFTPFVVTAWSIIVNAVSKWLTDYSKEQ